MPDTAWSAPLAQLRGALGGRRDARGQVGSLRWLEAELLARGGNPAAVRNVIYRDVGTLADKRLLLGVLQDLARGCDFSPHGGPPEWPALPDGDADPDAMRLLDRDKRRVYRRFLADIRRGRTPRYLITAGPGAGKTILIDHLSRALGGSVRARFEDDLAPELRRLAAQLHLPARLIDGPLSRLDAGAPFAVSGAVQQEVTRTLSQAMQAAGAPALLLRVGAYGHLGGHPLRLPDGAGATPAAWVWHHLLAPLAQTPVAVLAAVSSTDGLPLRPPGFSEPTVLRPPSLEDMRRFVHAKLPQLSPQEVEGIVRRADRDYDALGLLTLLAAVGHPGPGEAPGEVGAEPLPPLPDAALRDFLEVLYVLFTPEFPDVPEELLAALAGNTPLAGRRDLERAFVEPAAPGRVRPTNAGLIEQLVRANSGSDPAGRQRDLHVLAARLAAELGDAPRALHHALRGGEWELVLTCASGAGLERAWRALSEPGLPSAPPVVRERLARAVVEYSAALGRYEHPVMHEALEELEASGEGQLVLRAGVKRIEGLIDAARYDEARAQLASLSASGAVAAGDAVSVDLSLIQAALLRWDGNAAAAAQHVACAAALLGRGGGVVGSKVQMWRGLIAKDLGQWEEALWALGEVARDDTALHLQRARANYQLGDLWMRLGQQEHARRHLELASRGLATHGAAADEVSRSLARLGTVLRRLGAFGEAQVAFGQAADAAPNDFTRARALSEAVLLHAACGRTDLALGAGNRAWRDFRAAEPRRPLEAVYRRQRVEYRVALTYVCRALARPYVPPLVGAVTDHPDLAYARELLLGVLAGLRETGAEREAALRMDVHLALALATPDADAAVRHAFEAVRAAAHPYHQMQARTYHAEALLRAGLTGEALSEVNLAHAHERAAARLTGEAGLSDPTFRAWLLALEAQAIAPRDPGGAIAAYTHALRDPSLAPFHASLLQSALTGLTSAEVREAAAALVLPDGPGILRPLDAARGETPTPRGA